MKTAYILCCIFFATNLFAQKDFIFLSKAEAKPKIVIDTMEGFFNTINLVDLNIQCKTNYSVREKAMDSYKKLIQESTLDFSQEDIERISSNMIPVFTWVKSRLNIKNLPQIQFIKTSPDYYGKGVCYTRQNIIVLEKSSISTTTKKTLQKLLVHELFHVISRYNPELKKDLYKLIGFHPICKTVQWKEKEEINLLQNPDGLDTKFAIKLQSKKENKWVIPTIFTTKDNYNPAITDFFQYLKFDLFIIKKNNGNCLVKDDSENISVSLYNSFFDSIKDNTNYTIHPDEIIADNFSYLFFIHTGTQKYDYYSKEGRKLLKKISKTLCK